ncbi:hypothetical protein Tco_1157660 [Tanacetum coccineum]
MFKDLKKFQAELDKYNDVNYASKVEIDCAKAKGDLMSYKINFEKSSNAYTRQKNDLNQTISDMKKELYAHQEIISIMSQAKEDQIKLYKNREDKELDKVIALENKVKFLNEIDRLSREYFYVDHINAILGVYTDLDEVTNLQCDYLETVEKCEHLEKELSKSRTMSKSFEALQKHAINLELDLQQCKEKIKNDIKPRTSMSNDMSIEVHQVAETVTTSNELALLFGPLFDEYFNGENQVVLKSSAITTTDESNKRQQQPDSTSSTLTLATTVTANGNFDL